MQDDLLFIKEYGYLHIKNFISEKEHEGLVGGCKSLSKIKSAKEVPKVKNFEENHGSSTLAYLNKAELVPKLKAFIASEKINKISNFILNNNAIFHMNLLQVSVGANRQGIAWHRDSAFRFGCMKMVNFLFYPLGTDDERGGITILPGTHITEKIDIQDSFDKVRGEITLYPSKFDLIILDGACFHCVKRSISMQDRMSFNIRFRHKYAPKEITRYAEFATGEVDFLPDSKG